MAIRDYWIFQERESVIPWAIYVVKEFDKRAGKIADVLDYTLFSENIGNATNTISKIGIHCDDVAGYVNEILGDLVNYASVNNEDLQQLNREIESILND